MLTDKKIIKFCERLPEIQRRLVDVTAEITQLSKKQAELAKFCRFISRIDEIHEGVPLEVGPFYTRAISKEHTRYAYHRTHRDDAELRIKNMRWVITFVDYPPSNPDGTTNFRKVCTLTEVKNHKTALKLAKNWILHGETWLDEYRKNNA